MTLRTFNSVGGFSVGETSIPVIASNGNVTAKHTVVDGNLVVNENATANVVTANVINGNISVASANQANITTVGNLTSLTVVGDSLFSNVEITGNLLGNVAEFSSITTENANITNITVTSGTIDGTVIGGTTPADGTFANLIADSATFLSINDTPIGNATPSTGGFTELTAGNANITTDLIVGGNVTINKDLVVDGNLLVSGNTVTINTTSLTVEDPIVVVGLGNQTDALDLGIAGQYSDDSGITTKHTGIVRDNDTGHWVVFDDGEITDNQVDFVNVVHSTVDLGSLNVKDSTGSTSTTTGAVTVTGGAGIGGNLHVGGEIVGTIATVSQPNITTVGTLIDLNVAGNVVANTVTSNVSVTTPEVIIGESVVTSQTTVTTSTTPDQILASVDATQFRAAEFILKAEATNKYYVATVSALHDGSTVDYAIYGTLKLPAGETSGIISVVYSSGNMNLVVTPATSDSTTWTVQTRII